MSPPCQALVYLLQICSVDMEEYSDSRDQDKITPAVPMKKVGATAAGCDR